MTIGITGPGPNAPRRSALVGSIVAAVVGGLCLILLGFASDFLVDWLWFSSIGYQPVFLTTIGAKAFIFPAFSTGDGLDPLAERIACGAFCPAGVDIDDRRGGGGWRGMRRCRICSRSCEIDCPGPGCARWGSLLALLVAATETGNWGIFLQFVYQVPYGADDPLYGKDIGFYLFSLPAYILSRTGCCSRSLSARFSPERSTGCTAISNTTFTAGQCHRP